MSDKTNFIILERDVKLQKFEQVQLEIWNQNTELGFSFKKFPVFLLYPQKPMTWPRAGRLLCLSL